MNLPSELLQFTGSLFAILALAWVARTLRLGKEPRLADDAEARRAAAEAVDGFEPSETGRDRQGRGAILRDAGGRLLVLRPHGSHFASRILTSSAKARLWQDMGMTRIEIDCCERGFGKVYLDIDNPEAWAEAVNRLGSKGNA